MCSFFKCINSHRYDEVTVSTFGEGIVGAAAADRGVGGETVTVGLALYSRTFAVETCFS
jgi:hypothetical protein